MDEKADALRPAKGHAAEKGATTAGSEERLLEIGAEGGSISLLRVSRSGRTGWILKTNERVLLELLGEEDRSAGPHRRELGPTFEEALAGLDRFPWFRLVPTFVHAEVRDAVEAAVRARGGEAAVKRWNSLLERNR